MQDGFQSDQISHEISTFSEEGQTFCIKREKERERERERERESERERERETS